VNSGALVSTAKTIRTPQGFELRHCSGASETLDSTTAIESGRGLSRSKTLPRISPLLLRLFTWYCRGYIRRHFHSLRVSVNGLPSDTDGHPTVLFANHASWWDPLVGLVIKKEFFRDRSLYVPIDAMMLQRYRMFAKLGFFGVEQGTRRGAVQFLRTSQAILQDPNHLLAVTPQSRFADVRERPLRFRAGLGHLAAKVGHAIFLPMATEFVFWDERLPEILVRFGEPVLLNDDTRRGQTPEAWSAQLERRLAAALDALAVEAQRRDPSDFRTILRGGAGQGGIYDLWRALKAKLRGETFAKEHGNK
jgi:1-acyl-sn-glycerol-3-phosphate acyltransferase